MTPPRRSNTKHRLIPVSELLLHGEMNREVRPYRRKQLRETMNLDALGTFHVWVDPETERLYVIDGQHRKLALEDLDLADWKVDCKLYFEKSFAEACELFLLLNEGLKVRPFDQFDKGVKANRPDYVFTKKIVEEAGFKIGSGGASDGHITAVVAVLETYRLDEGVALRAALDTLVVAYGHKREAVEGNIVKGLGLVYARHNGQVDRAVLGKKLAKFPGGASGLLGAARGRRNFHSGALAKHVANVVLDAYNRGRRGPNALPPV